jgi:hypothetical protein
MLFTATFTIDLSAQISGSIEVRVSDATQASVPGATVKARSLATETARTAVTNDLGVALITQLAIGDYEIKVEAAGFAVYTTTATVNSGATVTVPIAIEVKGAEQTIVVTEAATLLNTVNAQLQNSMEAKKLVDLPLSGNSLTLAGMAPGIAPVTPRNPFLGLGSFNSNGGRGRGNNITLDNATATDISTTGSAGLGTVPIDGIKEFNLITNNFNAEYGRNASAQVQILTKNGSNEFHGRVFEFFRNDKLNARDYFDRTGKAAVLRDNDYGVVAGGALKKDRAFWFGTYEAQKIRGVGGTRIGTVPRPDQVSGSVDPTAAALLTRLQVPTSSSGTVSNGAPLLTNSYAFSGRVDLNLTRNDFLYVRVGMFDSESRSAGLTFISSNLPTNGASSVNRPVNATISETHAFGPRTVNQFMFSFGRSAPQFAPLFDFGGPEIVFQDGTSAFGTWSGLPQGRVQNTFQYLDTVTRTQGAHQFKFGGEVNRVQANSTFDSNVRGTLTFLTLNDFLQGRPFQYTQRFGNSIRGNRVWNEAFFMQDDYKVARNLTLNLGVRLEIAHGVTEVNDILSNLDLNKGEALGGAGTGVLGAFDIGGSSFGTNWNWGPRFGFAWNPRSGKNVIRGGYGIAYDFIYLNPITNMRFLPPFMYNFALPSTGFTGTNTFANLIAGTSEFQQQGRATVGTFGTTIRNFGAVSPVDQDLRNPQVQQWSLTIERELSPQLVARASYVGTKGNFLQRSRPLNTRAPGQFSPPASLQEEEAMRAAGVFTRINAGLNASLTTPGIRIDPRFNGVTRLESSANSNYHSAQFQLLRRFDSGYSFQLSYTISKSIDDGSDALGVLVNESPLQQNPFDNRNNRALSQFDIPQRLVIQHLYEPQFAAGIFNSIARNILHGWQFNGFFQIQSGQPATIFSGTRGGVADPGLLGVGTSTVNGVSTSLIRANLAGPINVNFVPNPGLGSRNPNLVTASNLTQPLVGSFGNLGRNMLRLNRLAELNWTLGKSFKVTERLTTQFQAQIYNVFNNTAFSRSGQVLSAPATFGYYSDTDTNTRNMTMVLRFIW